MFSTKNIKSLLITLPTYIICSSESYLHKEYKIFVLFSTECTKIVLSYFLIYHC